MASTDDAYSRHPGNAWTVLVIVVLVALLIAVLFPLFVRRDEPIRPQCMTNIRQLMVAVQIYMQDHESKFPSSDIIWQDVNFPPKALICPEYRRNVIGYAYNACIGGCSTNDPGLPPFSDIPVLADSKVPTHLLKTRTDIDPRHTQKAMVGFADGHVTLLPLTSIPPLKPENESTDQPKP